MLIWIPIRQPQDVLSIVDTTISSSLRGAHDIIASQSKSIKISGIFNKNLPNDLSIIGTFEKMFKQVIKLWSIRSFSNMRPVGSPHHPFRSKTEKLSVDLKRILTIAACVSRIQVRRGQLDPSSAFIDQSL